MVLWKRQLPLGPVLAQETCCWPKLAATTSTIHSNIKSALSPKKTPKETTVRLGNRFQLGSKQVRTNFLDFEDSSSMYRHAEHFFHKTELTEFSSHPMQPCSQVVPTSSQRPYRPAKLLATLLKPPPSPPWKSLDLLPQVSLRLTFRIPADQWQWI